MLGWAQRILEYIVRNKDRSVITLRANGPVSRGMDQLSHSLLITSVYAAADEGTAGMQQQWHVAEPAGMQWDNAQAAAAGMACLLCL
jgi:hypothetical protein